MRISKETCTWNLKLKSGKEKKKCQFLFENEDDSSQSPENSFCANVFYKIKDTSLNESFELLHFNNANFGFLNSFLNIDNKYLKSKYNHLENLLRLLYK